MHCQAIDADTREAAATLVAACGCMRSLQARCIVHAMHPNANAKTPVQQPDHQNAAVLMQTVAPNPCPQAADHAGRKKI
jgi:hypothetical protein